MEQSVKEIVLKGFDCDNPKTKSLVIWVSGTESEIERITDGISDNILSICEMDIGFDVGDALGIDFQLPKHEQEFLTHVENLMQKSF